MPGQTDGRPGVSDQPERLRVPGAGGYLLYIFSGSAIDRSKKYIKTIKNHMKIDAVDPWAAADNHPPTTGHNGKVYGTLQPPKPRQLVRCLRMLTHARSYLNPSTPHPLNPVGDPLGLDRLDRSGIPEGSIDSIGDPLGGIP